MFCFKAIVFSVVLFHSFSNIIAIKDEKLNITVNGVEGLSAARDLKSRAQNYGDVSKSWQMDLQRFDLRYSTMPEKCGNYSTPKDCTEATLCTQRSGVYKIENYNSDPYYVECDVDTENGEWLVIQRRQDGSVDFYRDWLEYEHGFGEIGGEFWIGLKKLYALTNFDGPQELLIIMDDYNLTSAYAKYDNFSIGNANEFYALKSIGTYSGTAGDALSISLGMKFSTRDRDNDIWPGSCAQAYTGAWWYIYCSHCNPNGKYGNIGSTSGIFWTWFRGYDTDLKYFKMMIRRRKN